MLAKLEEKGQVAHRADGRVNVYRPLIRQDQVSRSMVTDLADRLFNGDVTQMVCHLLDGSEITPESLAELKRLIRQKEKELKDE
jgi:predicted transcriptional regulator